MIPTSLLHRCDSTDESARWVSSGLTRSLLCSEAMLRRSPLARARRSASSIALVVAACTSTEPSTTPGDAEPHAGFARPSVRVVGRHVEIDGEVLEVRGVDWNPVPRGGSHPADLDYAGAVELDATLMAEAGIDAVRSFEPITDRAVLDALHARGIRVLNTIYPSAWTDVETAEGWVRALGDHPAIIMWVIGNEWNYNGLYAGLSLAESIERVEAVAAAVRALDDRPVMTIYGGLPPPEVIDALPSVDVWGFNIYTGLDFAGAFDTWAARSDKPMVITEYGADAFDTTQGAPNLEAQAEAVGRLTQIVLEQHVSRGGVSTGGLVFEWNDEWWKDASGSPAVQDDTGIAPGGGPHPDGVFNEEWWGLVDIDRNPRPALDRLRELYR